MGQGTAASRASCEAASHADAVPPRGRGGGGRQCQDTRSLSQNRKIARKWLLLKLDEHVNGPLSKAALEAEKERRRKTKQRQRARKKYGAAADTPDGTSAGAADATPPGPTPPPPPA